MRKEALLKYFVPFRLILVMPAAAKQSFRELLEPIAWRKGVETRLILQ